jgi:3-methyl-2-oxobutanoate hydroxymethyltransferase
MSKTMNYLHQKKFDGEKITMLTCYDYPTAVLQDQAGIDVIFVGDSLGTNELGYERETAVTLDEIIHHLKAVRRGVKEAYLLADMPYNTYETPDIALKTAEDLLSNGADGVKLEGFQEEVVSYLDSKNIEVWAHLGYNPQFHETVSVQGKSIETAKAILGEAITLQHAGARMMVLELIPEELGKTITEKLQIPTIGIGAGRFTDGQVLIVQDMLGITPRSIHHSKEFAQLKTIMSDAFKEYAIEVMNGDFPQFGNVRKMKDETLKQFLEWANDI